MAISKYKTTKTFALFLVLTFAASLLMSLSITQAQVPSMKTVAFIDAVPNPVGVGQDTLLRFGVMQQLGYPEDGWTGMSITIVRPDTTTQTLTGNLRPLIY